MISLLIRIWINFRNRLTASRTSFSDVWETVKPEVLPIVQPPQKKLIDNVLQIIEMAALENVLQQMKLDSRICGTLICQMQISER